MDLCTACVKAKMHETAYQNKGIKATRVFEYLYCDVVVQFPVETPEGHVNSVTLIDKFSNYTWIENFRAKSDIAPWLIRFFEQTKRNNSVVEQIQFFSTDKGGEFLNKILRDYFSTSGIQHQTAPAHTSQYNAIAERANRTIGEMAEALRIYAHLAPRFWGYARKHAAFLRNRCPSKSNPGKRTPFEIRYGKKPDLTNIKIFGCPCFALIKKQDRKMNQTTEKAMPAIFVGYDELERA